MSDRRCAYSGRSRSRLAVGRSIAEDAGGVPGPVAPLGDVEREEPVLARDRAPVPRRMTPGIHARERGLEHVLATDKPAPRLGNDFRGAGAARAGLLR